MGAARKYRRGNSADCGRGLFFGSHSTNMSSPTVVKAVKIEIHDPPPDGRMVLGTTAVLPEAREALSPNVLAARMEVYAELVEQGRPLPLFDEWPDDDTPDPEAHYDRGYRCSGCGRPTPEREDGTRMMACRLRGWVTERVMPMTSGAVIWCPSCVELLELDREAQVEPPANRPAVSVVVRKSG